MFREKKFLLLFLICVIFSFMIFGGIFNPPVVKAQYWELMPPYNVLWPLWSPALSPLVGPIDPLTGLATPVPLLTTLTSDTILPVQPCLAWDPSQPLPWALYNTPPTFGSGLLYFDQTYGLNTWPPPYLQDPITGAPAPITYLGTWSGIDAFDPGHIEYYIGLANISYALTFGINGQSFLDLLTAAKIFGLPPILPY